MMKTCIDFDAHFTLYMNRWIEEKRDSYENPEAMEADLPSVYNTFLATPVEWLENEAPGTYFDRYDNALELCELVKRYYAEGIPVPDPMLERLCTINDQEALLALATDEAAKCEVRMLAIELLREVDSKLPMVEFIRWQVDRTQDEDLLESALESLHSMGTGVGKPAKIAFLAAGVEGKEALLDLLCDYPSDAEVFGFALEQFKNNTKKRALYAGYLAKLGDDHALETLLEVAELPDVDYIDYIEIRSAIERLGSEAPYRDFTNDPLFKAMRRLQ